MKPGIYPKLSNEDYHSGPGISNTDLGHILRSIDHYNHHKATAFTQSPSMIFGEAVHMAFLEPDLFHQRYIASKPPHELDWRRDLAAKLSAQGFTAEQMEGQIGNSKAKTIETYLKDSRVKEMAQHYQIYPDAPGLDDETIEDVMRARDNLALHPIAAEMVQGGKAETSYFWRDEVTGLLCKCRPDYDRGDDLWIDLKSTRDASKRAFAKSVVNFGYHRQAALYSDGMEAASDRRLTSHAIIAVENTAPFCVAVFELGPEWIGRGREIYREALNKYRDYLENARNDPWTGYPLEVQRLEMPSWA